MERVVGTLFALSLLGSTVCAAAEPGSASRGKGIHDSRGKTPAPPPRAERPIAEAEADEQAYLAFLDGADADRDARVNASELQQAVEVRVLARIQTRFGKLDRNHDGKVARREVPTMDAARFARFDADGDGSFTAVELAKALSVQVTRRCGRLMARLDFDGDGALSAADLEFGGDQRVAKLELATLLKSASK